MVRWLPGLTALRAFEAAACHESFSLAAAELHVTHAAISRQVRCLEAELGQVLFRRTGNRVTLNEAGHDLARSLSRAFDGIAAASHRLSAGRRADRLVIAVDTGLADRWLNRRLAAFQQTEPGLDIEIIPSLRLVDFPREAVDAAVHYGFDDLPPGLRSLRLMDVVAFPVCSPELLTGERPLHRPADLARHRLLDEQDTEWWRRWLALAGETDVDWSRGTIHHDSSLVLDAAADGQGVAVGDNPLAFEALAEGRLVKPFTATLRTGTYYLVRPERDADHPGLDRFETWLADEFKTQTAMSAAWAEPGPRT